MSRRTLGSETLLLGVSTELQRDSVMAILRSLSFRFVKPKGYFWNALCHRLRMAGAAK